MNTKKLISILIPVRNEESNIYRCWESLSDLADKCADRYQFEFVFTDNHSEDRSYQLLNELVERDKRVQVFRLSRNFGYQASIYTAYMQCRGRAAIQFDCDLQDPPEVIPVFLQKWERGYKVVYGVRNERKEGLVINCLRTAFYRLLALASRDDLPENVGDFRLVDRVVIEEMRKVYDATPYLRGMISRIGFAQTGVPYARNARLAGKSKFGIGTLWALAWDGFTSHSISPLRLATVVGLFTAICTFLFIVIYVVGRLASGPDWPPGFATMVILLLFGILLNAVFLGIIGEYVGRIYLQVKRMPISIIEEVKNGEDTK
jgi:polyisoprenyl-phosphate glycosyltransferase